MAFQFFVETRVPFDSYLDAISGIYGSYQECKNFIEVLRYSDIYPYYIMEVAPVLDEDEDPEDVDYFNVYRRYTFEKTEYMFCGSFRELEDAKKCVFKLTEKLRNAAAGSVRKVPVSIDYVIYTAKRAKEELGGVR